MKRKVLLFSLCLSACLANSYAEKATSIDKDNTEKTTEEEPKKKSRLTLGGYGEAVYTRNFYSDNMYRYSKADSYKDSDGHGRVDLPHVVIMIGYDFGKGWSMGSEIEFEHGGTESAIEVEDEEAGEFEKEIERGGEVALEQFWIQKSFCSGFNIRAGHIIVPIGQINNAHLPTQFFTVYRPEGENTIMPCTWHETGLSVWGRIGDWRYEAMVIPALNANMFNHSGWIHDGSASAYEFKVANNLAGAARIDNYSVKGLRMGISGYIGNSFQNDIIKDEKSTKYKDVKGTVVIGAFDFDYNDHNWVVRGNFDYGHLVFLLGAVEPVKEKVVDLRFRPACGALVVDEPHRAHTGHFAPWRADAGPIPQQIIGQAGKAELRRFAALFHRRGQRCVSFSTSAVLTHQCMQAVRRFFCPDAVLGVLRRGEGERCHGVKQTHQMLHFVAGRQAGNINLHVVHSLK